MAKQSPALPRLTMKQIGALVGVSQSTVSRVLSGAPSPVPVAQETRERILKVVAESGYTPNPMARALRGARTALLGLIVRDIDDPFFGHAIASITAEARRHGYNVVLGHVGSSADQALELREVLEMGHCDGALLLGDLRDQTRLWADLVSHPTPLVGLWQGARAPTIQVLNIDNRAGIRLSVEHLASIGHRRIAFLQGGVTGDGVERREAYLELNPSAPAEYIQVARNTFADTSIAAANLLRLTIPPTAIVASTDVAAIGAINAAARQGLHVPRDVSVVGFDDIPLAAFVTPALTTVHQPMEKLARAAVKEMLAVINTPERRPKRTILAPSFVQRGSTTVPRERA
jgi:DNA-binding LacI/PurR family transcriptional regulator